MVDAETLVRLVECSDLGGDGFDSFLVFVHAEDSGDKTLLGGEALISRDALDGPR